MKKKFVFDVDGTLTPSRGIIDLEFKTWFNTFCLDNEVYLVTGSDRPKTIEQISEGTYNLCKRVYNCNGNDVYEGTRNVRRRDFTLPEAPHEWLAGELAESGFPIRTGNHFEHRIGMVNFSVVGRNANKEQRAKYIEWDRKYNERETIAHNFNLLFPDLDAKLGGETGLDITPKGYDKSQIMLDFWIDDKIIFFGDRIDADGNDYPLAVANMSGTNHHVRDWQHTWEILKTYV